ncbi:purine-cytosine permease family protein [Kocuria palustris]|uniref:Permease for cytosine/purine, uracil, thiamine, allantoin n=1 Tax=Kocuria palustris PEL TaxID=1236550 RepID=M2XTC6_9MICC|nr:cytosine permease [Kocuria palustris]EME36068.1 permease for cytosine/purine, uracil, thiamine, allantoin [Kocuria palustris PEL]
MDIPPGARPVRGTLGLGRILLIWLAANLVVTTILTGTMFVPSVPFADAVLWAGVGTLAGTAILSLIAVMGARTGLSTMALSRASFGLRRSQLPSIANVVILMGWSWVQAMLAGLSVDYVVHDLTGFSQPALFAAASEAIVVGIALFGHRAIERVEPLLGLLTLAVMAFIFQQALTRHSPGEYLELTGIPGGELMGIDVFDIAFATAISWTVLSADLTRAARTQRAAAVGSSVGYATSTILAMVLGIVCVSFVLLEGGGARAFDPALILDAFGAPLAAVMFLSVMAANSMALYGMTLTLRHAFPHRRPLPFVPTALGLGAAAVAGSTWLALLERFTDFLSTIGSLFIPVFAVMIVDYYLVRRRTITPDILRTSGGRYWFRGGWHAGAVVSWALGAVCCGLLSFVWPSALGAMLPTVLVTAATYLLWCRATGVQEAPGTTSRHLADALDESPATA